MFYPSGFWDIYILNKLLIKYKRIRTGKIEKKQGKPKMLKL